MKNQIAGAALVIALAATAGCGDTKPSGDQDDGPTTSSTGVPYNDEDNDGKAPAEG